MNTPRNIFSSMSIAERQRRPPKTHHAHARTIVTYRFVFRPVIDDKVHFLTEATRQ